MLGAKAIGAGDIRILSTHILPNLASVVFVQSSLLLSAAVLVEASSSFLGLGAQPPVPSLGLALAEGRNFFVALTVAGSVLGLRDFVFGVWL